MEMKKFSVRVLRDFPGIRWWVTGPVPQGRDSVETLNLMAKQIAKFALFETDSDNFQMCDFSLTVIKDVLSACCLISSKGLTSNGLNEL